MASDVSHRVRLTNIQITERRFESNQGRGRIYLTWTFFRAARRCSFPGRHLWVFWILGWATPPEDSDGRTEGWTSPGQKQWIPTGSIQKHRGQKSGKQQMSWSTEFYKDLQGPSMEADLWAVTGCICHVGCSYTWYSPWQRASTRLGCAH